MSGKQQTKNVKVLSAYLLPTGLEANRDSKP